MAIVASGAATQNTHVDERSKLEYFVCSAVLRSNYFLFCLTRFRWFHMIHKHKQRYRYDSAEQADNANAMHNTACKNKWLISFVGAERAKVEHMKKQAGNYDWLCKTAHLILDAFPLFMHIIPWNHLSYHRYARRRDVVYIFRLADRLMGKRVKSECLHINEPRFLAQYSNKK